MGLDQKSSQKFKNIEEQMLGPQEDEMESVEESKSIGSNAQSEIKSTDNIRKPAYDYRYYRFIQLENRIKCMLV